MRRKTFWLIMFLVALCLSTGGTLLAQAGVRVVVVNEYANVRVVPAIGAEVVDSVDAGTEFIANAHSGDNEWLRIDYYGSEGWIHISPVIILEGNVNDLPVADPRTIPYGGFESPRAGATSATGPAARLTNWLRLRAGPSTGYPVIAEMPYTYAVFLLGRNANNSWFQVNFEGTLGWMASGYLEFIDAVNVNNLPVGGIVADSPPLTGQTATDYISVLMLMRDRLDLAQPSLDHIRAAWTDAALAGRASCAPYPARPSDMHIAPSLLSAYYPVLFPLGTDFNTAMANLRHAIDLFIEVCNQPGLGNPVGTATVQGALGTVNTADGMFASLRGRLNELIPPDREPGANECLLSYNGQFDILPVIQTGVIYMDSFEPDNYATGYCFDVAEGRVLFIQTMQLPESNIVHFMSVSPLDNPTDFVAVGAGANGSSLLTVSPVLITQTGRYLLILTDIGAVYRDVPPNGNFALIASDTTDTAITPGMIYDPETGQVVLSTPETTTGEGGATCPDLTYTCSQLSCEQVCACFLAGNSSLDGDNDSYPCEVECGLMSCNASSPSSSSGVLCPSPAFNCTQLFSCEEAYACLQEGGNLADLDPDNDGIPCEETLCGG